MEPELIPVYIILYIFIFLIGIEIGSFLNVCIYRIPNHETVVTERSHCMSCGYQLKWYDMIPVFSWLCLRGKCRKCKSAISAQYPIVEAGNGILYIIIFGVNGFNMVSVLYCLMASALLVLSIIDIRTYEIPFGINVFIFALGLVRLLVDNRNWSMYLIGFFAVSVFLEILLLASHGKAIGGGDVKLMAAAGLLLGWKEIILAFFIGCILGSVIHLARMKIQKAEHMLAMGPYLSAGIFIAALWGEQMVQTYMEILIGVG